MAANPEGLTPACPGGMCERGAPPLSQSVTTNRNLPQPARGGQGSFDSRARSGWESGLPTPAPPAPGSPCGSRRTSEARATDGWESGSPTPSPPAPGSPCGSRRTSESRREALDGPLRGSSDLLDGSRLETAVHRTKKKLTAANPEGLTPACPGGMCERGAPPLSQSVTTNRNLPQPARGGQGSFDSRARSGWESGLPTPAPPAPGSPCGSRRTSEARATDG